MKFFGLGPFFIALMVIVGIVLVFLIAPFLLMLALNYVFFLLFTWKILANQVVVTFWESFWLMIAFLIIRIVLFGQHLSMMNNTYTKRKK